VILSVVTEYFSGKFENIVPLAFCAWKANKSVWSSDLFAVEPCPAE